MKYFYYYLLVIFFFGSVSMNAQNIEKISTPMNEYGLPIDPPTRGDDTPTDQSVILGHQGTDESKLLKIIINSGGTYCVYRYINNSWCKQMFATNAHLFAIKIGTTTFSSGGTAMPTAGSSEVGTITPFTSIVDIGTPVTTGPIHTMTKKFTGTYNSRSFSVTMKLTYNTSTSDYFIKEATVDAREIPSGTPIILAYGWDAHINTSDNGYAYIVPDIFGLNNCSFAQTRYLTTAQVQSLRMVGASNSTGNGALLAFFPMGRSFDRAYTANPYNAANCFNMPGLSPTQYKFDFGPFSNLGVDNGMGVGYDNIPAGQITVINTGLSFTTTLDGELDYFWNNRKNHTANIGDNVSLNLKYTSYSPTELNNVGFRVGFTGLQIRAGGCTSSRPFIGGTQTCVTGNEFYKLTAATVRALDSANVSVPVNITRAGRWVVDGSSITDMTQTLPLGNPAILTVATTVSLADATNVTICKGESKQYTVKFPGAVTAAQDVEVFLAYTGATTSLSSMPASVIIREGDNSATFTVTASATATAGATVTITLSGTNQEFVTVLAPASTILEFAATITASATTGGSVSPTDTCVKVGRPVTLRATPNNINYIFEKWLENGVPITPAQPANYTFTVTGDRVLVAQFKLNTFIINVSANPTTGGTVSGDGTYDYEEEITVHAIPTLPCYEFKNWTEGGTVVSTSADYTFEVTANRDLVANFKDLTPVLTSSRTIPAICSGSTVTYEATSDSLATTFSWVRAAVTGITEPADLGINAFISEVLTNPTTAPITVTYVYTLDYNGCTNTQNVTVVVNPIPVLSNASTVIPSVCSGERVQYTATCATSRTTFSWARAAVTGITPTTGSGTTAAISERLTNSTSAPITVTYVYTLTANGCDNTQEVTVVINPIPRLTSATEISPVCSGETVNYEAESDIAGTTFSWTREAVTGITPATGSGTNAIINETLTNNSGNTIEVTYTYTLTANGCSSTQEVTLQVYSTLLQPNPVGAVVAYNTTHTFNLGAATGGFGPITYLWEESSNGTTWSPAAGVNHQQNYTTVPLTARTYYRRVATNAHCDYTIYSNAAFLNLKYLITVIIDPAPDAGRFDPKVNGIPVGTQDIFVEHGGMIDLCAVPSFFYTFDKWSELGESDVTTECHTLSNITAPHTLTLHFIPKRYTITIVPNNSTWGSVRFDGIPGVVGADGSVTIDTTYNTPLRIIATPNPLYRFSHWEENGLWIPDAEDIYDFRVNGDHIFVAIFEKQTFTIKVYADPDACGEVEGWGINVPFDEDWTVIAHPSFNCDFVEWTVETDILPPVLWRDTDYTFQPQDLYYFITDNTLTLIAKFQPKRYNITLEARPSEGGTVWANPPVGASMSGGGSFPYDTYISIEAIANTPIYKFKKWVQVVDTGEQWFSNDPLTPLTVTRDAHFIAIFEREEYEIRIEPRPTVGGNVWFDDITLVSNHIPHGTEITVVAQENSTHTFRDWTEEGNPIPVCTTRDYTFRVTHSNTLYANFVPKTFDIHVAASPTVGGQVYGNGTNIPYGSEWTVTTTPNANYMFVCWQEDGECLDDAPTNWRDPYTFPVTRSRDLVALYRLQDHTITLSADPPHAGNLVGAGTYPHGTEITVSATATDPCFTFLYWTENGNVVCTDPDFSFPVTEDRHLVAKFRAIIYNITLIAEPREGGSVTGGGPYACQTEITISARPERCFGFLYWIDNNNDTIYQPDYTFVVTEDRTFTAYFTRPLHDVNLSVRPRNGGTVTGGGKEIPCGTEVEITATPEYCYRFLYWTDGINQITRNPHRFTVEDMDYDFEAVFEYIYYNITVNARPPLGGSVWGGGTYPCGDSVTVCARANPFYNFIGWTDGSGGIISQDTCYTFLPTGDYEITANFEIYTYEITLSDIPLGTAASLYNAGTYLHGETATIGFTLTNPEYTFLYWTEGTTIINDPTFSITVTGNHHFVAHFAVNHYTITLLRDHWTQGEVEGGSPPSFPYDTTILITAIPNQFNQFVEWREFDYSLSTLNPYPVHVTGNRTITAVFEPRTYSITLEVDPVNPAGGWAEKDSSGFAYGALDTVIAHPYAGFVFDGWYEDDRPVWFDTIYPFTVISDRHLVAKFRLKTFTVNLFWTPSQGGRVEGGGNNIEYGTIIDNINAYQNPGYRFVEWRDNDSATTYPTQHNLPLQVFRDYNLTAYFMPLGYDIIVSATQGGTACCNAINIPYETDTVVRAFAQPGYKFKWWEENGGVVSLVSDYHFRVTNSRYLTAVFESETYDITLTRNPSDGGMVSGGGYNLPFGTDTMIHAVPFEGYDFYEWTRDDGSRFSSNANAPVHVTESLHLTAQFLPKGYNITLAASPTVGGDVTGGGTNLPFGDSRTLHAIPKPGYTFIRWEYDNGTFPLPDYPIIVTESKHYIAVFELQKLNVIVYPNPTEGGTAFENGYDITYGTMYTVHARENAPHYHFENWTKEDGSVVCSTRDFSFPVTESRTLVANFKSEIYTVKLSANPASGGILTGAGDYYYNVPVTINASAGIGYVFKEWTTQNGAHVSYDPTYTFPITESCTFVAHFEAKYVDVTLVANPPEYGTVNGGGVNIPCNQPIPIVATPLDGYTFINWTEEPDGNEISTEAIFTFIADRTCTLVANFEPKKFDIRVVANPPHCGTATGNGTFEHGYHHTVSAEARDGFMLINWTEEGVEVSRDPNYSFTVDRSRTLVANFDTLKFTVTVDVNNPDFGEATGGGQYGKYETATVKAIVDKGYRFLNWTENGVVVSRERIYSFEVTQDVDLVANFYALEFDDYAATLWDNTFMLDLKRFDNEHYNLTGCRWIKNDKIEILTNTINEFSYSAGPKSTDLLETAPTWYMFQVNTQYGWLYSTKKVLKDYVFSHAPAAPNGLYVYPNPVIKGAPFQVEGADAGSTIRVYNQYGVCVGSTIAKEESTTLSLNLPSGIYLIRAGNKEAKVVVVNM